MKLYIEGHNSKRGYAISRSWSDAECAAMPAATEDDITPVRFIRERARAFALVQRFNRRFATH